MVKFLADLNQCGSVAMDESEIVFRERYRQVITEGLSEMPPALQKPKNAENQLKKEDELKNQKN